MPIVKDQYPLQLHAQAMPIFKDQCPSQLHAQARTALLEWYAKNGLEGEELAEKVRRVMKVQFGVEDKREKP